MIDRVHSNTTSLGPRVALDSELVHGARGLCSIVSRHSSNHIIRISRFPKHTQHRLVSTTTTGNNTDHTTGRVLDDLLGTTGKLDTGLAVLRVLANNGHVVTRGTAKRTTVTSLLLDVGDNGTLGNGGHGEDVADGQGGVLPGVDELASVHSLVGDEGLGDHLVLVGVTELDLGEGSTTAGVVDDFLHDTTDVSMSLGEVRGTELGGSLVETGVSRWKKRRESSAICLFLLIFFFSFPPSPFYPFSRYGAFSRFSVALTEDGSTTLSLIADHTTHGDCLSVVT